MKTVGFPISHKENENRRAIVPNDLKRLSHPEQISIETGFGDVLGLTDKDFKATGCHIASHEEVLQADIICDPKVGDADYLEKLHKGQTIFGWVHATQNRDITDKIIASGLTAYAWEHMFENGRHTFWFNNELAGEAAVIHAFQCYGRLPFGLKVAVIGNGNTARGAVRVLNMLGAHVMQYSRKTEQLLRDEIGNYDVILNCILWDVNRKDHIVSKSDLKRMKRGSMIIDVSCDRHGGIETSIPTTIENPTYVVAGVTHYAVDHTPSLFYKTFSYDNSKVIYPYIEKLMTGEIDKVLQDSLIFENGNIIDQEIIRFQNR
ncbi:N(5)-(carboxyethyl)ornithine synthase [Hallerella sp.]|uniref:N(5)-(carboxyethyl)ornithine synthase n=1 Tax=Hallerella sp. TaxID=2815812 RepID=UPI002590C77E|nr:N(5)-(carboxyethyl)ornithine synthase [Hallerella sp.]MCI6873658.1 N(5)-(carboxyethyl)ornithine synthase [Hallerella sp.]